MEVVSVEDITEAFKFVLNGQHEFTDTDRDTAQKQVRQIIEDRIYTGRRPQGVDKPWISLSYGDVQREYTLAGEYDSTQSTVDVEIHSPNRRLTLLAWQGVRQALTSFKGSIQVRQSTITIGGCTVESESETLPDEPQDGSSDFDFVYLGQFRVTHTINSPTGLN